MVGACMAGGCAWQGACMAGGCAWQGACMTGGVHGRGCVWQGACVAGGVHVCTAEDMHDKGWGLVWQ